MRSSPDLFFPSEYKRKKVVWPRETNVGAYIDLNNILTDLIDIGTMDQHED